MSDLTETMAQVSEEMGSFGDNRLGTVSSLAKEQLNLEQKIEEKKDELKRLNEEYQRLTWQTIPDTMDELGISKFELTDGSSLSLKPQYSGSVNHDRKLEALHWLEKNNEQNIIKTEVTVSFKRGQYEKAADLAKSLIAQGYLVKIDEGVHGMTMKSWIKQMVEDERPFPHSLFNAKIYRCSVIKRPKVK